MTYTRKNTGTCSTRTTVTIEDGVVTDCQVIGGCNGNLKGICSLVRGMKAQDAVDKMLGITCGYKSTSCPDQIALCIQEALAQ